MCRAASPSIFICKRIPSRQWRSVINCQIQGESAVYAVRSASHGQRIRTRRSSGIANSTAPTPTASAAGCQANKTKHDEQRRHEEPLRATRPRDGEP